MSKMTEAYEKFIREIDQRLSEVGDVSSEGVKLLVDTTQAYLEAAGDLSKDEWALVTHAVKQDLTQWRQGYVEAWQGSPSMRLLTDSIWHWLVKLSDTTQIEWLEVSDDIHHRGVYNSGEYIGLGEVECTSCGHKFQIWHPQKLEPCDECGHHYFYRHPLPLDDS